MLNYPLLGVRNVRFNYDELGKEKKGGLKCMRNDSGKKTGMQGWRI